MKIVFDEWLEEYRMSYNAGAAFWKVIRSEVPAIL